VRPRVGIGEDERSALAGPPWSPWAPVTAVAVVAITIVDAFAGHVAIITPLLVLAPLTCALFGRWRDTAFAGVLALAAALVSIAWNTGFGTTFAIGLIVVAVGGLVAIQIALLRAAGEVSVARFRLLTEIADVGNRHGTLASTTERVLGILVPALADFAQLDGAHGPLGERGALGREALGRIRTSAAREPALELIELGDGDDDGNAITVPLRARGDRLGVLVLGLGPSHRRYAAGDVAFARVLADRVALALDNAGLSRELSAAERQLGTILEELAEPVTVMDTSGQIVYANDAAIDLLRVGSAQELYESGPGDTMARYDVVDEHGEPVPLERLPGFRLLRGEPDPPPMLVRNIVRATGEERWLVNKASAVTDDEGRTVRVVNVIEDVTDARRRELSQRLLAEASRVLASSLNYEETLQRVAEVAVPALADWCGVDVPGPGGEIQPVGVAHVDPDLVALARRLRSRYPVRMQDSGGIGEVISRGETIVSESIPDDALVAYATDDEHLEMLRAIGLASLAIVPLAVGHQTLGALTLARSDPVRRFSAADVELAEELGRRAGTALLNARLYTEHVAISETLQRGLRPPELLDMPGFSAASRYRPAGALNLVGGDFFDAFPVADGHMLIIGDVAGQGAEAAALTGLARFTLRSVGQLTGDPSQALHRLNATLRDHPEMSLVTAVSGLLQAGDDGGAARMLFANAGHPPPILVRDGAATMLGRPDTLAGAFDDGDWGCSAVALRPGDALLLYTDGVLDTVGEGDRFGEERLLEAVRAAPAGPAALLDHLDAALDAFQRGPQRDDMAMVAVRYEGSSPGTT
jgi:serine phosphatase RsbU (regulator of sigma subunit)/PAS domain-containing protein